MFGKNKKSALPTSTRIAIIDGEPFLVETTPLPKEVVLTEVPPIAEKAPKRAHRAERHFPRPHLPSRPFKKSA